MIIDARKGDGVYGWYIYDVKRCRNVCDAVWVDDETATWGRLDLQASWTFGETVCETVTEDRITIYASRKLILFNEVDLSGDMTAEEYVHKTTEWRVAQSFRSIKNARG